jgi:thioredoxin reductase/Pyruvate/2-oxoacid:ferredoxin oxidoreductase delta subunit
MNEALWTLVAMGLFVGAVAGAGALVRRRRATTGRAKLEQAVFTHQHIPPSLYPVINPDICISSFSCLNACPEGDILNIMDGRPHLVQPSHCIGHGKCAVECPVDAIRLVFGTSERGVDLPEVDEFFESSRPGVHIIGELGGMGLIRNAMTQGIQLARHLGEQLAKRPEQRDTKGQVDVAIVGSGPSGLAMALGCREAGLSFRVLEQGSLGGTVAHYPRQKVVMTETLDLPLFGKFGKKTISKEELLSAWTKMAKLAEVTVEERVKVTGIHGEDGRFEVQTTSGPVVARKVALAIGRRGTPRIMGVPGEELPKVSYRLIDPDQYAGASVLVVGGGDSALEAAIQLANQSNAAVAIAYRGSGFGRTRQSNREQIEQLAKQGRLEILYNTVVNEVRPESVGLDVAGHTRQLANDFVIACLGGELPTEFLKGCDIHVKRLHGEALHDGKPHSSARAVSARERNEARHRNFSWVLFGIGVLIIAGLWWHGSGYYLLPKLARHKSPLHAMLKPAGQWGHGVGIVATGVMMLNYLYALRKRWGKMKGFGDIRYWLSFHVFVGSLSPMVIAFHAAFQSNNVLASSTAAAMVVLVATGLIGRFLVSLVPMRDGKMIDQLALEQQAKGLRAQVNALLAGTQVGLHFESLLAPAPAGGARFATVAAALPRHTLAVPWRLRQARTHFESDIQYKDFARSILGLSRVRIQLAGFGVLRRYLAVWRVLHVGLSLFMVVLIIAHIGVSLYVGFVPTLGQP